MVRRVRERGNEILTFFTVLGSAFSFCSETTSLLDTICVGADSNSRGFGGETCDTDPITVISVGPSSPLSILNNSVWVFDLISSKCGEHTLHYFLRKLTTILVILKIILLQRGIESTLWNEKKRCRRRKNDIPTNNNIQMKSAWKSDLVFK